MGLLEGISSPRDLRELNAAQTVELAAEIREFLVASVSRTGGHLGPNLGVVELTLGLHRVFESPRDTLVFDTGHQAYVHKMLTGRQDFDGLRSAGGLSGYPSRAESEHDVVENSHASTSLSWADGIAKANEVRGLTDRHVVAVIGDGALTGGMAWEALNNIAAARDRKLVIVVNDNGRSYAPTIGGLAHHLDTLRTTRGYESFLEWGKRTLKRTGPPGELAYDALHGLKRGLKDVVMPQGLFADLGIKYIGPVDGHDVVDVVRALRLAKDFGGPVIVHVITEKGRGYTPAEQDTADRFHGIGPIHPETGLPVAPSRFGWTSVFASEMVEIGRTRPDVVAITAAMLKPVGLADFAEAYPTRVFDVGIAEQHAATSAAGLAYGGLHPVVALYATFLNRAFDQILMDVALHHAGVTFVLDRAGITGEDGASHNGMWDMAMLRIVPGLHLAAPRDAATLREALRTAVDIDDAPSVVRYPKGPLGPELPAVESIDGVDLILHGGRSESDVDAAVASPSDEAAGLENISVTGVSGTAATRVLLVGIGAMAPTALEAGHILQDQGHLVTVACPTWVLPMPSALVKLAADYDVVVTIEDGLASGGVGALLLEECSAARIRTPILVKGLSSQFLNQDSRAHIVSAQQLRASDIVQDVTAFLVERHSW